MPRAFETEIAPTSEQLKKIKRTIVVCISQKAGRFYISLLVEMEVKPLPTPSGEGIGIDLGIKEFAVLSDGRVLPNINKSETVKKLEKKLKRERKRLSKKYEMKKKRGEKTATYSANIAKQVEKIQRIHQRLAIYFPIKIFHFIK